MMGISFITVPVLVDINPNPAHLVRQWARLYGYGHQLMPAGAIATTILYISTIINKIRSSRPWHIYAFAILATMGIVPFTWYVMAPTNNLLFGLDTLEGGAESLTEVHGLISRWRWLHMIRSMFPLMGVIIGLTGTLEDVSM